MKSTILRYFQRSSVEQDIKILCCFEEEVNDSIRDSDEEEEVHKIVSSLIF